MYNNISIESDVVDKFVLHSKFKPQAIDKLVKGFENGDREQVLLGATGLGKTFTLNSVAENIVKSFCLTGENSFEIVIGKQLFLRERLFVKAVGFI